VPWAWLAADWFGRRQKRRISSKKSMKALLLLQRARRVRRLRSLRMPLRPCRYRPGRIITGSQKKIHNELEKHLRLKGVYLYKDRRFETRAIDSDAHRGYQKWHRDLDGEIADHIGKNSLMNQEEFESYLRSRYAQPDLLARFRNGL
jgi:hypothetical protein